MNTVVACVVVTLLTLPIAEVERACPANPPAKEAASRGEEYSLEGTWQLRWNDEFGSAEVGEEKRCDLKLRADGDRLVGEFIGPVAGSERDAEITGMLHEGDHRLLTLEQREPGYVCCYHLSWPAVKGFAEAVGVWHDTRGGSGSFAIRKYQ